MPDFKVTFRGDLGNLAQFDSAVRNSAISAQRAFQAANVGIASSVGKITGAYEAIQGKPGLFIKNQGAVADAVNNTFRQTGQIIRRFVKDYEVLKDSAGRFTVKPVFDEAYMGNMNRAIGNMDLYNEALKRNVANEKELLRVRRNYANTTAKVATQFTENEAIRRNVSLERERDPAVIAARGNVANIRAQLNAVNAQLPGMFGKKGVVQLRLYAQQLAQQLQVADAELAAANAQYDAEIQRLGQLDAKAAAQQARADATLARRQKAITRRQGFRDIQAAAAATPPIDANLARVLAESPDLRKQLLKGGLGLGTQYGTQDFQRALAQQEAAVSNYTRNLRTGVRTINGEFRDARGMLNNFTVDLDDQGKVIGRWGGQLGGAGSILKQTVRDFQKVIEWTIATTVVFGTLATVVGQLKKINDLNTSLTRFSITAQTSAQETSAFFQDLTNVAIATATPLNELVTVSDDIALATKEAGDSTDTWRGKILALTEAVGIFTNLTGKDTVQAADQLSSTFKQLDIAPQALTDFLSKVTAVAGGQANAISDIVQSISGLAEAAKAAGLTVDEQIASVQVLAQVTSKSSAEVATAFKNLFGSVSSVGSEKILKEFGINIRDAQGGLRGFLDIYRDVKKALDSGVIPQNRLPDVLRGIAGGPRRAPDAAALLSNIERIDAVVQRSQGATNEALIANAKVLDTNQAKIIQFQNAIDAAIFQEFSQAVKDLTGALTSVGTVLAHFLDSLDSGMVTTIIKTGLLVGGLFSLVKVLGFLGRALGVGAAITGLKNLATGFKNVGLQATEATVAMAKADAQLEARGLLGAVGGGVGTPGTVFTRQQQGGGIKNFLRNNKTGLLIGAAGIGGAVLGKATNAGNGNGGLDLGTALQLGGAAATLIPGLQAIGIAAAVAGTAIQLFTDHTEDAKKGSAELAQEIYNLTTSLRETQDNANQYAQTQRESLDIIDSLQNKSKRTAEEQARLSDATSNYVTATLALADANRQVSDTFDQILQKMPELEARYGAFKNLASANPNDPFLKELQQRLTSDILRQSGQGIYGGAQIPVATQYRGAATRGNVVTGGLTDVVTGVGGETFDLRNLINNPEMLRKIFGLDRPVGSPFYGKETFGGIPRNETSIRLVQSALNQLLEEFKQGTGTFSQDELDALVKAVTALSSEASSFTQNAGALAQLSAQIQAKVVTGQFTGPQAANAQVDTTLASRLNAATQGYQPKTFGSADRGFSPDPLLEENIRLIQTLSKAAQEGQSVSNQLFVDIAENALQLAGTYDQLKQAGDAALREGIIQWLADAGVQQEVLDALGQKYNTTLKATSEEADAIAASFAKARQAAAESYANRSLQLLIQENSGQFEGNAKGLAMLKQQNQEAYDSSIALIDAMDHLSQTSLVDLNNQLANVVGLNGQFITSQELSSLTADELAGKVAETSNKLIENAVAAGVNQDGIEKLRKKVLELIGAIVAIPPYKQVIIDIETKFKTLSPTILGSGDYGKELQTQLNTAKQQEKAAKASGADYASQINKIIKQINKIISSGSGSNFGSPFKPSSKSGGGGGGSSAYNAPGLLDIPEEILNSGNAQSLIQQAIKNARSLQGKVPGATKANQKEIVELLNGTKRVLETRGIGEEFLRRAMDELRDEIKRQNDLLSKADTIRRIRVGGGDFSAIANVPINSKSGVSVGGVNGPISVALDVNGTVFSPAQLQQFADMVAASLKRQLAS